MTKKRKKYDAYIAVIFHKNDKERLDRKLVEKTLNHNNM
jgi:hypothetical protein